MLTRKHFIQRTAMAGASFYLPSKKLFLENADATVMTVTGPMKAADMKFTLTHEHVLADFIGADNYSKERYNADEVYTIALPFLQEVKSKGCYTFIDCSPAYLGRDVKLLQRLSKASGLNIITNTGFYGAVSEKFLPRFVYHETAEQIASRWIKEWTDGIEGTEIKPGFLKTSVDKAPLSPTLRKIIDAAAITHLATGLTIGVHTGDGDAAKEQLEILNARGVAPNARIWIHAQNEKDNHYHIEAAKKGSWVSFDGVNPNTIADNLRYLQTMKNEKLLDHVLVSQDSGWYNVGEPRGGNYKNYITIFSQFIPALQKAGFTSDEINKIFIVNPANAFAVSVRKG